MMKKLYNGICTGLVFLLLLSILCGCGKKNEYNIFTEFANVTEDSILPQHVKYGQTLEVFMQERNLTEESILNSRDYSILLQYAAGHIPYEIREAIYYIPGDSEMYPNEIYQVEYIIIVNADDAEETFAAFYAQAKAVMPEPEQGPPIQYSLENIKTGGGVVWADKNGNILVFSSSEIYDPQEETRIAINIKMRCGLYPTRADLNPNGTQ